MDGVRRQSMSNVEKFTPGNAGTYYIAEATPHHVNIMTRNDAGDMTVCSLLGLRERRERPWTPESTTTSQISDTPYILLLFDCWGAAWSRLHRAAYNVTMAG